MKTLLQLCEESKEPGESISLRHSYQNEYYHDIIINQLKADALEQLQLHPHDEG